MSRKKIHYLIMLFFNLQSKVKTLIITVWYTSIHFMKIRYGERVKLGRWYSFFFLSCIERRHNKKVLLKLYPKQLLKNYLEWEMSRFIVYIKDVFV